MSWTLVMFIYAGMMANGDSVTLHSVTGFGSQATCEQAGKLGKPLVKGTQKDYEFVCLPVR